MLERIKKKETAGFKEFVSNLETTAIEKRLDIIQLAILEDPIYMEWVLKNVITVDKVLDLPTEEIRMICQNLPNGIPLLAKTFYKTSFDNKLLNGILPQEFLAEYKDAADAIPSLTKSSQDAAGFLVLKTMRTLQEKDQIVGPSWLLPPVEILKSLNKIQHESGFQEITFDNGVIAAKGNIVRNKRDGEWCHYFQNGKLMAKGTYSKGYKHGIWTFYYSDEKIKSQGEYIYDSKEGEWSEVDKNGVKVTVVYKEGLKV